MNRHQLQLKLDVVTSKLLREKEHISFVDVFMELGYLDPKEYENWRMKRVPYLERAITANLSKINFIIKTVRKNCRDGNCRESWTGYKSWGKGRKMTLRFSKSAEEAIERTYATHFFKPEKKMKKAEQAVGGDSVKAADGLAVTPLGNKPVISPLASSERAKKR
ncbi:MAG: hypothetical protein ACFCVA_06640 [Gammaproteobacteria bacterium]